MPPRTIDFDDSKGAAKGIPRASVTLVGPGGPKGTHANFAGMLVDTGATHTHLPEDVAHAVGIDPSSGTSVQISTANGMATRQHLTVDLEIEGVFVKGVDVYFALGASPLLGRSAMYAAFPTTGFESAEWLRRL
jgi:predicted aspartyl protease